MPIVNPLVFYPWRVYDFMRTLVQWLRLVRRYKAIQARVEADPAKMNYTDEALDPDRQRRHLDHFVEIYADKDPPRPTAHRSSIAAVGG